MKNFENHARKTLTADGLQERYVDRRVEGYDKIDKKEILDTRNISFALVDTYGMFDLTECSSFVDESEYEFLTKDRGIEIPIEDFDGVEIDFDDVVEYMLEVAKDFICEAVSMDLGKPLEMEVISYFSPSEYNYSTDWGEYRVLKNPFDTIEELAEYLKKSFGNGDGRSLSDDLIYHMREKLDEYMYENITGYNIMGNEGYREKLSLDELEKIYKK